MVSQRPGSAGRSALSSLCGVLAVVLLPVALVAFWASVLLTRTDVFVDELKPVVSTPQVQEALTDGIVDGVLGVVQLRPVVEQALEGPLRTQAATVVASPQVAAAWTSAIRAVHTQLLAVMEGRADTQLDADGRVAVRVAIPVPALTATLERFGVTDAASIAPVVTIPLVRADDLRTVQQVYRVADAVGPWAPAAVGVLALLAVALARRRGAVAAAVGAGWIVLALGLALVVMVAREPLMRRVTPPVARTIADTAYGLAARNLYAEIGVAVGAGLVLLLLAGIGHVVGRRRAGRPA